MAKISQLPVLPDATGDELVPAVSADGVTRRASLKELARGMVAGTEVRLNRAGIHAATVTVNGANDWSFTFPVGTAVVSGDWIRFRAPATPTGPLVVRFPEGVPDNFWNYDYNRIAASDLVAGRWYIMERIVNGGGSHYRTIYDDAIAGDARSGRSEYGDGVVAAGSGDVAVTTPESPSLIMPRRGTILSIFTGEQATTEGQPLRIWLNGYGGYPVLTRGGSPLTTAIAGFSILTVMWRGGAGNSYILLAVNSAAPGAAEQLDANLKALRDEIALGNYGTRTYARGIPTDQPNYAPLVGTGTSVGNGAGALHYATPAGAEDWSPVVRLGKILSAELNLVGNWVVPVANKCVNGSFDDEAPVQFAARGVGFESGRLLLMTPGMNAATAFGQFAAATKPGQIAGLRTVALRAIAQGYIPILQNTMHQHPLRAWRANGADTLAAWNWPSPTLNITVPITTDAGAKTIAVPFLSYEPFGGTKVGVGSVLRFTSGPNAGVDHIVTGFAAADVAIIGGGSLIVSEAETRQLLHVASAAENETLMPLPPSKRYASLDRTGSGKTVMGLRLFDAYNAAIDALAVELGLPLIDIESMGFDFVEANGGDTLVWNEATRTMTGEAPGWDAGFTTRYPGYPDFEQYNHPNVAMRVATFDRGARKLARIIARGELTRTTRIR